MVSAPGSVAQTFERATTLASGTDRSGRAFDGRGRYRRGPPTRVRIQSLFPDPTLMPSETPAFSAGALLRVKGAGGLAHSPFRLHDARLGLIERGVRLYHPLPRGIFFLSP
ncbi:MAG: hypothetical protein A3J29_02080 [Acidobacteria bacterium RIFCSPLOWO2_12_FULL_67_14b]|nr:MAG: hypothetical protein A3J29_02080 [Acidobacteria bacterium RIFCSPLOWO2_12_FULL_67_14b]